MGIISQVDRKSLERATAKAYALNTPAEVEELIAGYQYAVSASNGRDVYLVHITRRGFACNCAAGVAGHFCYHVAACLIVRTAKAMVAPEPLTARDLWAANRTEVAA